MSTEDSKFSDENFLAHSGAFDEVQMENDHFRITKWTIMPGGTIPLHKHEYEYVVVPLVTDIMLVTNADGTETRSELQTGLSYTREAGAEHEVSNPFSEEAIVFVEIERL